MMNQRILIIVGPTGSGKSDLAVRLARKLDGEVVSADSRQVYKGLDIGSGKITKREMRGVTHHLLDVASPKKTFTASQFSARARKAVDDILRRGKLPIICGGTGFYIDAFMGRIVLPEVPPNNALRKRYEKMDASQLFSILEKNDPARAATIDRHNPRRLIRALEIAHAIGSSPRPSSRALYDALWIGLKWDQTELDARIMKRLLARIRAGMLSEGKRLHARGLSLRRMESLGLEYRAMAKQLRGDFSRPEMIEQLYKDIRQYSRRQMVYWSRNPHIHWCNAKNTEAFDLACAEFSK